MRVSCDEESIFKAPNVNGTDDWKINGPWVSETMATDVSIME